MLMVIYAHNLMKKMIKNLLKTGFGMNTFFKDIPVGGSNKYMNNFTIQLT